MAIQQIGKVYSGYSSMFDASRDVPSPARLPRIMKISEKLVKKAKAKLQTDSGMPLAT
jgi:hypothetical protein